MSAPTQPSMQQYPAGPGQSDEQSRQILESITDAFFSLDREWRFRYINGEGQRILHRRAEELVGRSVWEAFPEAVGSTFDREYHRAVRDRTAVHFEEYFPPLNTWYEVHAYPSPGGLSVFFRDVNSRKRSEALLRGQKRVLEDLVTGKPLPELLAGICEVMEEQGEGLHTSVLLLSPDRQHLLHGAGPSLPEAYNAVINGIAIGPAVGSCGRAAFSKQVVVVRDIATDPLWKDFRDLAMGFGLRSCWSSPILSEHAEVLGTFAIYTDGPHEPGPEERSVAEVLARTAAVAIEWHRAGSQLARATEEVARRERLLEAIASATPDLVYVFDREHRFQYANRALLRMWGRTWDESIGKNCLELGYEPWHAAMHDREIDQVIATGQPIRGEVPFQGANGRRTYDYIFTPVLDEHGAVEMVAGTTRDVTERKEAEANLEFLARASAELASSLDYETTLSNVARLAVPTVADWCAVHIVESDGSSRQIAVAHVDPEKVELAWELHRRYPEDPEAPRGVPYVLRTGEPDIMEEIPAELLAAGARDDEHRRIIRSLGLRSYVVMPLCGRERILGAITFVSAESGRLYGQETVKLAEELARRAAFAVENATLYREAQSAREVEARRARQAAMLADVGVSLNRQADLRTVLEGCTEALVRRLGAAFARVWTLDPTGTVLELQASSGIYTHIDGGHARVPVGKFKIGLIAEERQPHLTNDVQHDPRVGDPEWARREGMVSFAGYPLLVEERLVGVLALFAREPLPPESLEMLASISGVIAQGIERRRAEEQVRALNASLEQRVAERTAALAESNRELEAFSYSVSHDLRAPIRHIAGFAQMLERNAGEKLDATGQRHLKTIQESARQAGVLVDDLLSFSRMGRSEMRWTRVDLNALVPEVRRELDAEAAGRMLQWEIGPLPVVEADPAMLRLVLRNLLSNAVKYTRGREDARIQVGAEETEREYVVHIMDNGVGFDMQYVDKLFGVFQRLHGPDEFEGTGIGLANVRRIIHRHGGRTWAEGDVGQGATFSFSLPKHPSEEH